MKAGGRKPGMKVGSFRPKRESWNLCIVIQCLNLSLRMIYSLKMKYSENLENPGKIFFCDLFLFIVCSISCFWKTLLASCVEQGC